MPGSLIVVRATDVVEWEALGRAFPDARWKVPSAPFILWAPTPFLGGPRVGFEAAAVGFRGVIIAAELDRKALTEPFRRDVDMDEVVAWLRKQSTSRQLRGIDDVRALLLGGAAKESAHRVASCLYVSLEGLAKRLRRNHLPSPFRILRAGRLLATLPSVQQREHTLTGEGGLKNLETVARENGLSGGGHLRREYREMLGVPPSSFAGTLGWEWVVQRWWAVEGGNIR